MLHANSRIPRSCMFSARLPLDCVALSMLSHLQALDEGFVEQVIFGSKFERPS